MSKASTKALTRILFFIAMVAAGSGQLAAQEIISNQNIPALNACGDLQTITVEVSGLSGCTSPQLQIEIPDNFELEPGSIAVGGTPVTIPGATTSGATVPITGASATITYQVRALCAAIPEEGDESPVVNYTLTGCGTTLEAESEALNVIYAVLHPTVSPTVSSGIIGENITRTITVTNNGNGSIRDFYVKRELGAHLLYVEVDPDEEFTADYPGWDIDSTTHAGYYRFSSSTVSLLNGQSISFDETVVISGGCADLSSTYTAYYVNPNITNPTLAASVCEKGSGDITTDVSFNASIKPRLEITKIQVGDIECLDGSDDEQIFKVENIGAGVADAIELLLGTGGTGATYFDATSVEYSTTYSGSGAWSGGTSLTAATPETWAAEGALYSTTGLAKQLSVTYPNTLAATGNPGDVVYIRVVQKHNPRTNPGAVLCDDLPPTVEFGNSWVEAEYNHPGDCNAPIESDRVTLRDNLRYAFSGVNMGEIDVIPGEPYLGDFALTEMIVDSEGIGAGGELTISVEFSPNLINTSGVTLVSYTGEPLATATGSGTTFSFTIPYDQAGSVWENYSINPRLDLRGARLQFSTDLECPSPYTGDTFFKVTTSLKRGASCPPIESACVTNLLANKCADGPCDDGGLTNGRARIIRTSLGETEANPYVNGLPNVGTTVDPTSPNVRVRAFTTNDILRISQEATAHPGDAMPADGWKTGNMTVTIPAGVEVEAVANSAQITVTRGGSTATATLNSATVDIVEDLSNPGGYVATMAFDVTDVTVISDVDGIFTSFTGLNDDGDDDNVLFSFEVKVINNGTDGLKEFGVISALTDNSGTPFLCGDTNPYTATGYYASGKLTFTQGGNGNITSCATDQRPKSVTLNYSLMNNQRNMLFPAEFKQAFFPKTAVFANISSGLQLNGVRLVLRGQGTFSGATIAPATIDIPTTNTAVFTSSTTFDIEAALALLQGTGPHLDEGFELQLFPIVGSTCSSNSTATMDVHVTYAGTVLDHSRGDDPTEIVSHVNDGDDGSGATVTEQLSYNTAAGALQAVAATPHTTIAVDKAQWVIQVSNSSTFRAMENVWLSKASGPLTITEIVPVDNYAGANPGTAITPTGGGIYGLGSLPTSTTRYYRITASTAADCADGAIVLNIGQACDGDLTNGCPMGSEPLTLQYTMGKPQIQARIVYQTTSTANLCDDFDYEIELNNAGNGAAKDITLTIPVVSASQFAYKTGSLEATVAYTGSTVPALADVSGTFTVVEGPSMIRVTIPNSHFGAGETLPAGSKINIKFTLLTAGCDFRSGQRIRFNAAANNICGNFPTTSSAASDRLNIGSATASAPVVVKDPSVSATVNSVIDPSGPLYATYNFQITNTTSNPYPLVGDPADPAASHRFSIKLPSGWTFVTALADLFPAEIAVYENDDAVRGHIFRLTSDVASGGSLELPLTSTQLRYTPGTPIADLTCTIGTIEESVYGLFTPPGVGSDPGDCMACALDQIFLESTTQITIEPEDPIVQPIQVFCAAENPRVSDLTAAGTNLRFYDSLTDTTPLAPTELLEVGSNNSATYYVTSSPIPNGACESDRILITVYMPKATIPPAHQNQSDVNATLFTVTGHAGIEQGPVSGRWSIVSVTGADLSEVGFGTAGTHTVAVTSATPTSVSTQNVVLPIGAEVLVRWTVTYYDCDSYTETTLRSTINTIEAVDNYYPIVNSKTGTYNVAGTINTPLTSVLNNTPSAGRDFLAGVPATTGNVRITPGTPNHPNLIMGSNGTITVLPNTPAGDYQYPYTICEIANLSNCASAVAYVKVEAPDIEANDNDFTGTPISGNGGRTPSVLPNDELNDQPINPAEVTISTVVDNPLYPSPDELILNPDGTISVAPGTPSGDYILRYKICEILNPTNCAEANATVRVRATINAVNDGTYQVRASTTTNQPVGNALDNDTLNGVPATQGATTTSNTVTVTTLTPATSIGGNPVPVLAADGNISVPAGTPAGDYSITYQICENNLTGAPATNCDQATITIRVTNKPIVATPNTYGPVKGNVGDNNLGNVLSDDLLDGQVATLGANGVTLTPNTGGDTYYVGGVLAPMPTTRPSINSSGTVIVPEDTPDGIYTLPYTICETANTANCATSYARVTVGDATIDAKDNHFTTPISGSAGGTTTSVIVDDRLNGGLLTVGDIGATITLTPSTTPPHANISMNPTTGIITVLPNTPAGTYSYPYTICDNTNPTTNCDNAVAVITVLAEPILADNDIFGPVNGATGSTGADIGNHVIFINDQYSSTPITAALVANGTLIVSIVHDAVPVRTETPALLVPQLNKETGVVSVPEGTPAGQYQITYRICEALNPTNCDDAIVTINVEAPEIVADADSYSFNGQTGEETTTPDTGVSVLDGDTLNGAAATASTVTLTPGTAPHPGISMSSTGIISVDAGTPAGDYTFAYTICEVLNPTNCATSVATITVTAPTITAVADPSLAIANGGIGGTTTSVLANDTLGEDDPLNPSDVRLVPGTVSGGPATVTDASQYLMMNPDGTITVRPGTPAGTYTYTYDICEVLNPTNCTATAGTATITVSGPIIQANDDGTYDVNGVTGDPSVGNILTNDRLNGVQILPGNVTITPPVAADTQIWDGTTYVAVTGTVPTLDANTGNIAVPPGTPAGLYQIAYEICDVASPGSCDEAYITINVLAAAIVANNDSFGPIMAFTSGSDVTLGYVLDNDLYNGNMATTTEVTILDLDVDTFNGVLIAPTSTDPRPELDESTGVITVPEGTAEGVYTITYRICSILNSDSCDDATVTITVSDATINAIDDHFGAPVNGRTGGSTPSVLNNDFLNGTTVNPTAVVLAPVGTLPTGITMATSGASKGEITVAANTPAGIYQVEYEICELANTANCDRAFATIVVTAGSILADNDIFGPFNGATGTTAADPVANRNVLSNDRLYTVLIDIDDLPNGLLVTAGDIIEIIHDAVPVRTETPALPVPTLDKATGVVSVPAGTPAGQYQITYRICEALNPTNCDDAIVTINVEAPEIVADADSYTFDGQTGNETVANPGDPTGVSVLDGDTLNGAVATTTTVTLTPGAAPHPGISMSSTGTISVAEDTPAGTYEYSYTICEVLNPTNCATNLATITVTAPDITAVNDPLLAITNGANGGTTTSVLANDILGEDSPLNPSDVRVVPGTVSGGPASVTDASQYLTMNPDGTISARPGTPEGTYTYTYDICEILNPTNCTVTAGIATITVAPAPIVANADGTYTVNGGTGNTHVANALTNDLLNNLPATLDKVIITTNPASDTFSGGALPSTRPALDPATGIISVPAGTQGGTYTITYSICERLNPTHCSTTTITIFVSGSNIVANDNTYGPVKGDVNSDLGNVLDNDTYNGSMATTGNVTITTNPANDTFSGGALLPSTRPSLNITTGLVSVPVGTADGVYTISYTIEDKLSPGNTSSATVTITIGDATIDAVDDFFVVPINGILGGVTTVSVLANDWLGGTEIDPEDPASMALIRFTPGVSPHAGISMDLVTGIITVAGGTPAGTYSYPYTICDDLNPITNCDNAVAIITVSAAPIVAENDAFNPVNGANTTIAGNVLDNDSLNGAIIGGSATITIPDDVVISVVQGAVPVRTGLTLVPTLDEDTGEVEVTAGTAAGTYHITYRICEVLNLTTNCDEAIATIVVEAPAITADADSYTFNSQTGVETTAPTTGVSVLANDELNGAPVTTTTVTLTPGARPHTNITMDSDGVITVSPNTPTGTYEYSYTICEVLNPTNCATNLATITVEDPDITAVADDFTTPAINGAIGGKTGSVLDNDLLGTVAITPSQVKLLPGTVAGPVTNAATYLTMNPDGTISVAPGTPAGTYTYTYDICEVLNPTNCTTFPDGTPAGTATIEVTHGDLIAVNDGTYTVNGGVGKASVANALTNDRLNGLPVTLDKVQITTNPADDTFSGGVLPSTRPVLDTGTGNIAVPAGTPAGEYRITYEVCEILNPSNCETAYITIDVTVSTLQAVDDTYGPVKGNVGNENLGNVLSNDLINGWLVTAADVLLTSTTTPPGTNAGDPQYPYIYTNLLDPTDPKIGTVIVPENTPDAVYIIPYQICEALNPTNCETATVTVTVSNATIDAVDDLYPASINGRDGGTTTVSVLANDLLNGTLLDPDDIILTVVDIPAGFTMETAVGEIDRGLIEVPAGTAAGIYEVRYRICEVLNPLTNCDEAIARIVVSAAPIDAIHDNYSSTPVNGMDGGTLLTVLGNDLLNNAAVVAGDIILTPGHSPHTGITMKPDTDPAKGEIVVAAGTPAGTYVFPYRICEVLNPTNCDDVTATVIVSAAPIVANDDIYAVNNGYVTTTFASVVLNDRLNGVLLTVGDIGTKVTLTPRTSPHPNITMDTDGVITVAEWTPSGEYRFPYQICEVLNPTNCDEAVAIITIADIGIVAEDDDLNITPNSGKQGGKTVSVLLNDLLGSNTATLKEVRLLPGVVTGPAGVVNPTQYLTMNPDGTISVVPNTPAGIYTYTYEICEILTPNKCDDATATITINAAPIEAVDDDFVNEVIYGVDGGTTVVSVLENDLLDGKLIIPNEVILTPLVPSSPALTMNPDGTITVAPDTPEGTYTYTYRICEVLNPANCDDGTATIYVRKTWIHAVDDIMDVQNTRLGATSNESVLTNDLLNNKPLVDGEFTLHPGVPSSPDLTMNPDGTINIAPGTKPGTYTYPYTICEVLNPTNCDDAVAIVRVVAPELIIPNVFTPNDDQTNQYFEIVGWEEYDYIELTIVNRWGNLVFKNDRYDNLWDGKGVNEGTYFYIVRTVKDGHSQVYKGYVTIKRH